MRNTLSKKEAVELIKSALRQGWTREVKAQQTLPGVQPYAVQVILSRTVTGKHDIQWAHIFISFRRGYKRNSISVSTIANYFRKRGAQSGAQSGAFAARYELERMAKEQRWENDRAIARAVISARADSAAGAPFALVAANLHVQASILNPAIRI